MNSFVEYLLKSGLSLAIFYLFYWLLLRRDTNFGLNRFVLLFSTGVSLLLPLFHFNILPISKPAMPVFMIDFGNTPNTGLVKDIAVHNHFINLSTPEMVFLIIYLAGALFILFRLIYQAIYLHAVSRTSKSTMMGGINVVRVEKEINPFSYFNKIFISDTGADAYTAESIIEHERSHQKLLHYIDIIIMQFLTIVHWFNPFAWLLERSVKEIHEFQADKTVLFKGFNQGKYQAVLVNQAMGGPVFTITSPLNQSLIKKRIVMMTKLKSPMWVKYKVILMAPLLAVLISVYSLTTSSGIPASSSTVMVDSKRISDSKSGSEAIHEGIKVNGIIKDKTTHAVLVGVNIVIKGSTSGTICDQKGRYEIVVPDNSAVLVFSFVGYKTQVIPVESNREINVEMESDSYAIDFSKGNSLVASEKDEKQSEVKPDEYVAVEEMPTYPGGTDALGKFLMSNLQYPANAKNSKIEGKVFVSFTVDKQGNVIDPKIVRSANPWLNDEALRVTKLLKGWKPGTQQGKPIDCSITLPIEFKLK